MSTLPRQTDVCLPRLSKICRFTLFVKTIIRLGFLDIKGAFYVYYQIFIFHPVLQWSNLVLLIILKNSIDLYKTADLAPCLQAFALNDFFKILCNVYYTLESIVIRIFLSQYKAYCRLFTSLTLRSE